jgi:dipeptidyl aminopeptidase/acylaminoacyl peptidase
MTDLTGASATAVRQLFGGAVTANIREARFASPADQVVPEELPPFLIMHGDQDRLVPEHQSEILYEKLKLAGANVQLVILPHSGHGYGWFKSRDNITRVYDFFDRCFAKSRLRAAIPSTRPTS